MNADFVAFIFYLKKGSGIVIRKCYARMSEPASGDRLTLEIFLSDDRSQIFIGDFDGGVAIFSHGLTGKRLEYVLQGAMNGGYVNLVRNQTIERTLYGVKKYASDEGADSRSVTGYFSLREGQILIIECQRSCTRKPIRLDELSFGY